MNTSGTVTLLLVFEPATSQRGPVPLVRVDNPALALEVAQSAIAEAEARAAEFLDESEYDEVRRLREVLALLMPGLLNSTANPTIQ